MTIKSADRRDTVLRPQCEGVMSSGYRMERGPWTITDDYEKDRMGWVAEPMARPLREGMRADVYGRADEAGHIPLRDSEQDGRTHVGRAPLRRN